MFRFYFFVFVFIHIIADYYLQNDTLAEQKKTQIKSLIKHCVIYTLSSIILIIPIYNISIFIGSISLCISHIIVDFVKFFLVKSMDAKKTYNPSVDRIVYIVDQILHLVFISVVAYMFSVYKIQYSILPCIILMFDTINISMQNVFEWALILLIIGKPANITIKKLLSLHKPILDEIEEDTKKAGGFIGLLERLIILVLLSINQFSAIGLVLTAKSIARYDEISKKKAFAEYYLLGTLLSAFIVICAFIVIV